MGAGTIFSQTYCTSCLVSLWGLRQVNSRSQRGRMWSIPAPPPPCYQWDTLGLGFGFGTSLGLINVVLFFFDVPQCVACLFTCGIYIFMSCRLLYVIRPTWRFAIDRCTFSEDSDRVWSGRVKQTEAIGSSVLGTVESCVSSEACVRRLEDGGWNVYRYWR